MQASFHLTNRYEVPETEVQKQLIKIQARIYKILVLSAFTQLYHTKCSSITGPILPLMHKEFCKSRIKCSNDGINSGTNKKIFGRLMQTIHPVCFLFCTKQAM